MKRKPIWRKAVLWILLSFIGIAGANISAADFKILVFSKTLLYRHASITNGIVAIKELGKKHHFTADATEDAGWFTETNLAKYQAVVFLSTSGEILNDAQQAAFKAYLENGGGLAAVHAAVAGDVATEGNWPWYGEALCARFTNHSAVVEAAVQPEDTTNPSTSQLPQKWVRVDEWYNFTASPRGKARVLASLDESTYHGGTMGRDHPIAWCHRLGKGRVWYTALGHTEASLTEPLFLAHLLGGIEVAAGIKAAEFDPQ
jgi:type 1 glutamine amidotransferase